jgi:hypothetical protein
MVFGGAGYLAPESLSISRAALCPEPHRAGQQEHHSVIIIPGV